MIRLGLWIFDISMYVRKSEVPACCCVMYRHVCMYTYTENCPQLKY